MMKDGRRKEDAMEEKKMNKDVRKRRRVSIGWHQVEIVFQNSIFVNAFIVYCHGSFVVATASHHVAVFVSLNASLKLITVVSSPVELASLSAEWTPLYALPQN